RREKATSNICTNQGLMALAFTIHMSLLGEIGFKQLGKLNHSKAVKLADEISKIKGFKVLNKTFFNEFVIETPTSAQKISDELAQKNIVAGFVLAENKLLLAATELTSDGDISKLVGELKKY
ncbi:MAG TPA: glycine dehydrogenase, partial [Alphaproteobacteria bacterium]|nr:glycine dehydrogenase [Alphaproteobacteria bacterium]